MTQRTAMRLCVAVGMRSLRVLFPCAVCVTLLAATVSSVSAQVVITEIMYDPPAQKDAGYEWIEIMNDGEHAVDMTAYRLSEGNTQHYIRAGVSGTGEFAPGAVGVIVQDEDQFKAEYPAYTGSVFLSKFSLRQQKGIGEPLGIFEPDSGRTTSYFFYTPDSRTDGTGASLHITGGRQIAAPATPGSIAINPITVTNREESAEEIPEEAEVPEEESAVETLVKEILHGGAAERASPPPKETARKTPAPEPPTVSLSRNRTAPTVVPPHRHPTESLAVPDTVLWVLLWIAVALTVLVLELFWLIIVMRGRRAADRDESGRGKGSRAARRGKGGTREGVSGKPAARRKIGVGGKKRS